jgi:hypothetical protein
MKWRVQVENEASGGEQFIQADTEEEAKEKVQAMMDEKHPDKKFKVVGVRPDGEVSNGE